MRDLPTPYQRSTGRRGCCSDLASAASAGGGYRAALAPLAKHTIYEVVALCAGAQVCYSNTAGVVTVMPYYPLTLTCLQHPPAHPHWHRASLRMRPYLGYLLTPGGDDGVPIRVLTKIKGHRARGVVCGARGDPYKAAVSRIAGGGMACAVGAGPYLHWGDGIGGWGHLTEQLNGQVAQVRGREIHVRGGRGGGGRGGLVHGEEARKEDGWGELEREPNTDLPVCPHIACTTFNPYM